MFDKSFVRKAAGLTAGAALLGGSFYAGVAYAADPRLDQANDNVTKAIALLQAAENPGVKVPFGTHRDRAVRLLKQAQTQIAKAKEYADSHPAPPAGTEKKRKKND